MLAGWAASTARFREDANSEDDHALGGYRDRVVVELAQNAADAATRAGAAGRLRFRLRRRTLEAANTGAPLDAAGVEALATLRASGKRDATTVGRFGVGFAAVLAVSDEPQLLSVTGGVRFARAEAAAAARGLPSLAAEIAARGGRVPVLRLPFPATGRPPAGFTTLVRLPLRDAAAEQLIGDLLADVGPALLLALPALTELVVQLGDRRRRLTARRPGPDRLLISDNGRRSRWRLATAGGPLAADLLADRPAEERWRPVWSISWAVPVDRRGRPLPLDDVPAVLHAPTPTAEPVSLPACCLGSFPLDVSRRQVAPGRLTEFLLDRAAAGYAALVGGLPAGPAVLDLVPTGLAAGELDARLRRRVLTALADTAFLPAAAGGPGGARLTPRRAVAVDDPLVRPLRPVLPGLLRGGWTGPAREPALAVLGVRRPTLTEVVDALSEVAAPPRWWRQLYAGLAAAVPPTASQRELLAGLPVPLADGRLTRGPRNLFTPNDAVPAGVLSRLGLPAVHPGAVHPLLETLGAQPARPRAVLADPRVRAVVEASFDELDDPRPLATAVLGLVHAAGLRPGEHPWLAELALPTDEGELRPAGELLLPTGRLAAVVDPAGPFGRPAAGLLRRWPAQVLTAVGVLDGFALLREADVPVTGWPRHDLAGEADWFRWLRTAAGDAAVVEELTAARDLELVRADGWPAALGMLSEPPYRSVVLDPAVVSTEDGRRVRVRSYTAWWLAGQPVLAGQRPGWWRLPDADPRLGGLFDPAAPVADPVFLRGIGVLTELADADPQLLAERLADPERTVTRAQLRAGYAELARRPPGRPPSRVRAVHGAALVVVPTGRAVLLDAPDLAPLLGGRPVLPAGVRDVVALSRALGLPLASRLADYPVLSTGGWRPVPAELGGGRFRRHPQLLVQDADGAPRRAPWRLADGELHVDAGRLPWGLGRGLAWAAGDWARRHLYTEVLRRPAASAELLAEADLEG